MIIVDKPYTSPELADYLAESGVPVLDNPTARELAGRYKLNLTGDAAFARAVDDGARVYTASENSLAWILENVRRPGLLDAIAVMKDKVRMRRLLADMYPDYFFREIAAADLPAVDPAALPFPLVLKPAVGFFSVGVHVLSSADEWRAAVADIMARRAEWRAGYRRGVVNDDRFILEEYIAGDEYALDVYFDENGGATTLNVMRHDFSSAADVSDRLYYTSPEIVRAHAPRLTDFMNRVNAAAGIRDFPVHVELRDDGRRIVPIEFNPLRFAGWCCTDLSWFAYGLRTYQYFLENRTPDWDRLLAGKEGNLYSMVILDKAGGAPADARFDYDAAAGAFTEVLNMRVVDDPGAPLWGFVFARTPADRREELDRMLASDLREFLVTR